MNLEVFYPVNIRIPMERANSIQIIQTCHALARAGIKVNLLVRKTGHESQEDILKFYGLPGNSNLRIKKIFSLNFHSIPKVWDYSFLLAAIVYLFIQFIRPGKKVLYTRDLGLTDFFNKWKRLLKIKIFFEVHNPAKIFFKEQDKIYASSRPVSEQKQERIFEKENRIFKNINGIITITQNLKDYLIDNYEIDINKLIVIPDGVDIDKYSFDLNQESQRVNLCYVGQLYTWKGLDVLLQAIPLVKEDFHIFIVGGIRDQTIDPTDHKAFKNLDAFIRENKLEDKVSLTGYLKPNEVVSIYKKCQIGIIPLKDSLIARYCTSPLKLFEYMASGLAIIATDLPSIREILEDGKSAVLFKADDSNDLAIAIEGLIKNPGFRKKIAQESRKLARKYSWDSRAQQIKDFMERNIKD